jgi:hypothetical protein
MMHCHIVTPVSSNFLLKNWIQARNFGCGLFFAFWREVPMMAVLSLPGEVNSVPLFPLNVV